MFTTPKALLPKRAVSPPKSSYAVGGLLAEHAQF